MNKWFTSGFEDLWPVALGAICIYLVLLTCTRIAGKRSFSRMSSFDYAISLAVASMIAATALSESISLAQGVIGIISLYLTKMLVAALRRYDFWQKVFDNRPTLLMDGPRILYDNMKRTQVTENDLRCKLREANVSSLNQVKIVVLETSGEISVVHSESSQPIENFLLEDVEG